ncbi:MAG: tRNA pseudouridine(55) synthase TruB [Dehalococcoidia bacterium]
MTADGILNVDKPEGITSFGVVSLVRRLSGVRKVGHAGTLDPNATGVLLVCLGQATRVSEYLMDLPKTYRATVRLGVATDTYDSEGEVTSEGDTSGVEQTSVVEALAQLQRQDEQVPPSFSAVKVGGTPAHRLARAGRPVALRPRRVKIEAIELISFASPLVEIEVRCGKGTYIRTLANDLGVQLGCGAHLQALRRDAVGDFFGDDAISTERLEAAFADGAWRQLLLPLDRALAAFPAVELDETEEADVRQGRALKADSAAFRRIEDPEASPRCRAYGAAGSCLAVLCHDREANTWRPEKVFIPAHRLAEPE